MSLYDNLSHRILITQTTQLLLIIIPPSATNFFSSNIGITSDSLRWKTNIDLFGIVDFNDFIVTNTQHRISVVSNKNILSSCSIDNVKHWFLWIYKWITSESNQSTVFWQSIDYSKAVGRMTNTITNIDILNCTICSWCFLISFFRSVNCNTRFCFLCFFLLVSWGRDWLSLKFVIYIYKYIYKSTHVVVYEKKISQHRNKLCIVSVSIISSSIHKKS